MENEDKFLENLAISVILHRFENSVISRLWHRQN